jgi:hypothetical protein
MSTYAVRVNGELRGSLQGKRKALTAVIRWCRGEFGGVAEFIEYRASLGAWIVGCDGTQIDVKKEVQP